MPGIGGGGGGGGGAGILALDRDQCALKGPLPIAGLSPGQVLIAVRLGSFSGVEWVVDQARVVSRSLINGR
jgi:hypothetical protein